MMFDVPQLLVYFACIGLSLLMAVVGSVLGLGEVTAKGKVTANSPVEIIKGIGPGRAKLLKEHGVKTVGDLLNADPKKLGSEIKGVSSDQIMKWQEEAREAMKGVKKEEKKEAKKEATRRKGGK
ncbi:MAG: helix-hairpin-helix domain-containing protein [Candidatus Jordarchaeales archaeon]